MRYLCSRGPWSDYTPTFIFTTLPPCDLPPMANVDPIFAEAAQLNWLPTENTLQTKLRYRLQSPYSFYSMSWQTVMSQDSSIFLENLRGGGVYDYQLQSICHANQSEWTEMAEFVLLCAAPGGIEV